MADVYRIKSRNQLFSLSYCFFILSAQVVHDLSPCLLKKKKKKKKKRKKKKEEEKKKKKKKKNKTMTQR